VASGAAHHSRYRRFRIQIAGAAPPGGDRRRRQSAAIGRHGAGRRAYGSSVENYISDDDVIAVAKANNSTRAIEAMRKANRLGKLDGAIVAIGNAPTALLEVVRLVREEGARPALVIGVPVGFVSAAESKAAALALPVPFIVTEGRKGGSPIAVAILHALLLLSAEAS
jgi:precorrin-8X/cobalt-precorrin-8 methylmutase